MTTSVEIDFFKTLSFLKSDNPAIYDKKKEFFREDEDEEEGAEKKEKKTKAKPVYLKDHERNRLLTKGVEAFVSDEEGTNHDSI